MSAGVSRIAADIREARKAKGLSQRELGARVGLPQSHISKIENGSVDIQTSSLTELARALDLEIKLVPRRAVPAVESAIKAIGRDDMSAAASQRRPAYRLEDDQ